MRISSQNLFFKKDLPKKINVFSVKTSLSAYDQNSLFSAYNLEQLGVGKQQEAEPTQYQQQLKQLGLPSTPEEMAKKQISMKVEQVKAKLKSGQELSSVDLEFLKEHAPDLYSKAVQIAKERQEYRENLNRCKTKDDVARVQATKAGSLNAEAQAVKGNDIGAHEFIGMKLAAIIDEHTKFISTDEYKDLPYEYELSGSKKDPATQKKRKKKYNSAEVQLKLSIRSDDSASAKYDTKI